MKNSTKTLILSGFTALFLLITFTALIVLLVEWLSGSLKPMTGGILFLSSILTMIFSAVTVRSINAKNGNNE